MLPLGSNNMLFGNAPPAEKEWEHIFFFSHNNMAAYSKQERLLWIEQLQQEQVDDDRESKEDLLILLWLSEKLKLQQNGGKVDLFDS